MCLWEAIYSGNSSLFLFSFVSVVARLSLAVSSAVRQSADHPPPTPPASHAPADSKPLPFFPVYEELKGFIKTRHRPPTALGPLMVQTGTNGCVLLV